MTPRLYCTMLAGWLVLMVAALGALLFLHLAAIVALAGWLFGLPMRIYRAPGASVEEMAPARFSDLPASGEVPPGEPVPEPERRGADQHDPVLSLIHSRRKNDKREAA